MWRRWGVGGSGRCVARGGSTGSQLPAPGRARPAYLATSGAGVAAPSSPRDFAPTKALCHDPRNDPFASSGVNTSTGVYHSDLRKPAQILLRVQQEWIPVRSVGIHSRLVLEVPDLPHRIPRERHVAAVVNNNRTQSAAFAIGPIPGASSRQEERRRALPLGCAAPCRFAVRSPSDAGLETGGPDPAPPLPQ